MSSSIGIRTFGFVVLLTSLLPAAASGSSPMSTFVVPSKVEYFPDKANSTSVVIHGAFMFWQDNKPTYTTPACGYMHFYCNGDGKTQTMCRMQWEQIEQNVGNKNICTGYGQLDMKPMGTLHPEGTPLGAPEPWDIGIGVQGASVGGLIQQCGAAQALSCPPKPVDPVDMATSGPPPDLSVSQGKVDMAQPPLANPAACSCSMGTRTTVPGLGVAVMVGVLSAIGLRSRRRRRD